jgi:hypothetical protein
MAGEVVTRTATAPEEPPARDPREEAERARRRAKITALVVALGTLIAIILYVTRAAGSEDHSLAGAPYVTNFVVSWRDGDQASVYTVDAVDPDEDPLTYQWNADVAGCGAFAAEGQQAIWTHPPGAGDTCVRHGTTPDGGIRGSISVVISDGTFDCTVVYRGGSGMGTLAYPADCVRRTR